MNSASDQLSQIIRERIAVSGPITFAEFMELALYHPEYGYYSRPFEKIGQRGDYYTSSDLGPALAELLAEQLGEMWALLGRPEPFTIVELGAGKGKLAADILNRLAAVAGDLYPRTRYFIVESSRYFRQEQRKALASLPPFAGWLSRSQFEQLALEGCVISNEFFDALPFHRLVQTSQGLNELYVAFDGDFHDLAGRPSTARLENYFRGIDLESGQQVEASLSALDWLASIGRSLRRGFVITIDYGYRADQLYSPLRRGGTMLCYYRHTVSYDPYIRIGEQDITAHVNFSALIDKGAELGLKFEGLTTQVNFLLSLGLVDYVARAEAESHDALSLIRMKLGLKSLISPGAMGEVFKVLIQSRGVEAAGLRGLRGF